MRRSPLLVPLLLCAVGCGLVQSTEDEATDVARAAARKVGERLYGQRPRTAEEVGRSASVMDGVEVMRVTGVSTHEGDGVEVIVRTPGTAHGGGFGGEEVVVRRCFAVRVSPASEWREVPRDVDCPEGLPLTFPPPPEPPRLPYDELRAALPQVPKGGRADETEVRRALAGLDLDPAIRTETAVDGGVVGVVLSVEGNAYDPQDCVVARVAPGSTSVWVPARIQRMRGEGGCSTGNALHPAPPPH